MGMTVREVQTDRSKEQASYFVAWSEFGTRYRMLVTPLAGFDPKVREEVGAANTAAMVSLWGGKRPGSCALFNAGGGILTDGYVAEKLGLSGEDLLSVSNVLRMVLVRQGGPTR